MNKIITTILLAMATAVNVCGQTDTARAVATEDTVFYNHTLRNVTVKARQSDRSRRFVANTEIIGTRLVAIWAKRSRPILRWTSPIVTQQRVPDKSNSLG